MYVSSTALRERSFCTRFCSWIVIRSRSFPMAAFSPAVWAGAQRTTARKQMSNIRSDRSMSVSYLKRDSDHGDRVDRTTILRSRTEADLSCGIDGILIEPVAEPVNDAQDSETSGRSELDLEHDIAFEACPASFLGVVGTRLEQNFERLGRKLTFGRGLRLGIRRYCGGECRSRGFGVRGRLWRGGRGRPSPETVRRCDGGAAVRIRGGDASRAESGGRPDIGSTGRVRGGYGDRKSTRLNSSHLGISYAVFCLKKK